MTAQAAYIYPRLALVADHVGDARVRGAAPGGRGASTSQTVEGQFVPGGWFARGYCGCDPARTRGDVRRAPAVGAARGRRDQRRRRRSGGRELPPLPGGRRRARGPDQDRRGARAELRPIPAPREQNEPAINGSSEWPGGAWFAVNGWMTWALAELDGGVPRRGRRTRGTSSSATRSPRTRSCSPRTGTG